MELGSFTPYRISSFVVEKKLRLVKNAQKWPNEWVPVLLILLLQSLVARILNQLHDEIQS